MLSPAVARVWPLLSVMLLLLGVSGLAWFLGGGSTKQTALQMVVNLVAVIALYIFVGNSGVFSFGHAGLMAVGAYCAALTVTPSGAKQVGIPGLPDFLVNVELPTLAGVAVAGLVATVVAAGLGLFLMRLSGLAAALATIAVLVVINVIAKNWNDVTHGTAGITVVPFNTTIQLAIGWALVGLAVAYVFQRSRFGLRLRASREDEPAALAIGVRVTRERYLAFLVSAFFAGVAGALIALLIGTVNPDQFYLDATFLLVAMLVVGGMRSLSGAVVGTIALSVLAEALRRFEEGVAVGSLNITAPTGATEVGFGIVMLAILLMRPAGITGSREITWPFRGQQWPLFAEDPETAALGSLSDTADTASSRIGVVRGEPGVRGADGSTLEAHGLCVHFAGVRAVDGVDFLLREDEILGLIGPNGAGKSTFVNVLSGFQKPTAGEVVLRGESVTGWSTPKLVSQGVVRTFQSARLFQGLTVFENVEAGAVCAGMRGRVAQQFAAETIERLDLGPYAFAQANALPHGVERRLAIARALACRPQFLLLDEPAAGLNEEESDELVRVLGEMRRDLRLGLVVIEHDMRLIMSLCERIHVLNYGKTVAVGTPGEVSADESVRDAYLGTRE